jgi:hypothetical protein
MRRKKEHKVEELSRQVGGRFKLTALVQKRIRNYHVTGRTFMPNVKNLDELFDLVLDQVENGQIELAYPEEHEPFKPLGNAGEEETAETEEAEEEEEEEAEAAAEQEEETEAEDEQEGGEEEQDED